VFLIDDLRNGGDENKAHGVNEVRLRQGRIVRGGLHITLGEAAAAREFAELPETLAVALRKAILNLLSPENSRPTRKPI
jgi:hypothetical protein